MGPTPAETLLAWLAVIDGPGAPRGQVFSLQPETIIGRTTGQIVLANDPYVSSQHAKIRQEASEEDPDEQVIVLYDMASANGSFVGSKEEYRDRQVYRQQLEDGDYLLIGETTLVFKKV
jgi:pSer/pThr/pTyr-binding forkhead associated (FHA) protein